jgi:hypothetical protein
VFSASGANATGNGDNALPARPWTPTSDRDETTPNSVQGRPMTQSATKSFEDEIAADDRILTAAEVAAYARIGLSTLRQYIYAGCGPPGFKAGAKTGSSRWKFRRADVDAWLDASRIVRRPRPNASANADAA